jgi:hypothetical protein
LQADEGVAALVRQANEAAAIKRAEIIGLQQQIAEIDAEFHVRERDREADEARAYAEEQAALRRSLVEAEEERLEAVARAEAAARAFKSAIEEAQEHMNDVARIAVAIAGGGRKIPHGLDRQDFSKRFGARLAGLLSTLKLNGSASTFRLGPLELNGGSLFPAAQNWRDDEEKRHASAIQQVIEDGGR